MEINGAAEKMEISGAAEKMEISGLAERELMFSDEELKDIYDLKIISGDYIEVICGCTSRKYGDAVGTLRVYLDGKLEIKCDCIPGRCDEGYTFFLLYGYNSLYYIK